MSKWLPIWSWRGVNVFKAFGNTSRAKLRSAKAVLGYKVAASKAKVAISRLLGNRFLENQLEFAPNLTAIYGQSLYGVMDNGRILLESKNGFVRAGVERHEVFHYVLDHLITPESKKKILDDIRQRLIADGLDPRLIDDTRINEYGAIQFERKRFDTSTISGRFFAWLHGVLTRFGFVKDSLADLFYRIENGEFRDAPIINNDISIQFSQNPSGEEGERSGMDSDGYQLNRKEKHSHLLRLFALPSNVEIVTYSVMNEIKALTAFASHSLEQLSDPSAVLGFKEAGVELLRRYQDRKSRNPGFVELNGERVSFDSLSDEQINSLEGAVLSDYIDYHLASSDVFEAIVSDRVPGFK